MAVAHGPTQRFVCAVLEPTRDVVRHLALKAALFNHSLASACDFEGSPCPWFDGRSTIVLLRALTRAANGAILAAAETASGDYDDSDGTMDELRRLGWNILPSARPDSLPRLDLLRIASGRQVLETLRAARLSVARPILVQVSHARLSPTERLALRELLAREGYRFSPNSEVNGWGDLTIAWRTEGCEEPLWHPSAAIHHAAVSGLSHWTRGSARVHHAAYSSVGDPARPRTAYRAVREFLCGTLEVTRPLVRQLFLAGREWRVPAGVRRLKRSISGMCTLTLANGSTVDVCGWLAQEPTGLLRSMSMYVRGTTPARQWRELPPRVLQVNAGSGYSCASLWAGADCPNADPFTELVVEAGWHAVRIDPKAKEALALEQMHAAHPERVKIERALVAASAGSTSLFHLEASVDDASLTQRVRSVLAGASHTSHVEVVKLQKELTGIFVTGPEHVWGKCVYREGFCDLPEGSVLRLETEVVPRRSFDEVRACPLYVVHCTLHICTFLPGAERRHG